MQKAELSEVESELMMKTKDNQTLKNERDVLFKHYQNLKKENRTLQEENGALKVKCDEVSFKHSTSFCSLLYILFTVRNG